ncbi:MAG: riboflavin synthase [Akkermansia sp.]
MFTGLVECIGRVLAITPIDGGARLTLEVPFGVEMGLGDSLAVNGCCLTVDAIDGMNLSFDLLSQTLKVTDLGDLAVGHSVNLERAMRADDRLGGHFVMGHVDTCGVMTALEPVGQDHRLEVTIPRDYLKYCIDKGSITIDGMSLTIANLRDDALEFWITPHTFDCTNLRDAKAGSRVNIEVDMLAKYVERLFIR